MSCHNQIKMKRTKSGKGRLKKRKFLHNQVLYCRYKLQLISSLQKQQKPQTLTHPLNPLAA